MERYFDINYSGAPFELFGLSHAGLMVTAALVGYLLIRAGRRASSKRRTLYGRLFGLLILINETGTHIWKLSYGIWAVDEALPLQLCGAMAWIAGFSLLLDIRKTYPMIYFYGIVGAVQGVITPDAGAYGFPHYQMVETFVAHSALVMAGLWVVFVEGYRPTFRHLIWILVGLNAAAFVMYFVNLGLGSNYLFVNAKPPNASIVDLMPEWPWYIPYLEVIAIVLFSSLYLPFARFRPQEVPTAAPQPVE